MPQVRWPSRALSLFYSHAPCSYLALMGGFALNPAGRGTSDNPDFTLSIVEHAKAIGLSIFTR